MRPIYLPILLLLLVGCTDFDSRYIVTDFRILAVAAVDSPEEHVTGVLLIDPNIDLETAGLEDLSSIFTVTDTNADFTIEPLFVDPAYPEGPFLLRARACLFQAENYTCDDVPEGDPLITVVEGMRGRNDRDLTFRFRAPPAFLNAALAADPLGGFGGLFILLDIEIEGPSGRVRAAKILTINPEGIARLLGLDPNQAFTPNNNPEMCALRVHNLHVPETRVARDGQHAAMLYNEVVRAVCTPGTGKRVDAHFASNQTPIAYTGDEIILRPAAPGDRQGEVRNQEQQYYVLTVPEGPGELPGYRVFTEQIQANIYVTGGSVQDEIAFTRTTFGTQISPEFLWTLPDTPGLHTVWVVLRDNRGGVSWIERTFDVRHKADLPVCVNCPNDPDYDWRADESAQRRPEF